MGMELLKRRPSISQSVAILLSALFIAAHDNLSFLRQTFQAFPGDFFFKISVFVVLASVLNITLTLLALRNLTRYVLAVFLLFAALHSYFTDQLGIVGDQAMILNILKTDFREARDLFNFEILGYLIFLGLLPSLLLAKTEVPVVSLKIEFKTKIRDIGLSLAVILAMLFLFGKSYASFFREHKTVRYYANPVYLMYSAVKLASASVENVNQEVTPLGLDAKIPASDVDKELIIFVLGETARSDRFSLNGYAKDTNPLLKNEKVFSFTNVYSCGTSTAVSVPCMFSVFGREAFNHEKTTASENLVDVLERTGRVEVLWRDNNSDSKGVAMRAPYEDFKTPKTNTICDVECRDEGMLVGLQAYINRQPLKKDIFIVLHQMGNHGPAYYKRYPKTFEKFQPACHDNDLGQCTNEEIDNAYDNAILYTDHFLSKVIQLLKSNDQYETAMFYVSDHGESLGENGIYLHGLPYSISPVEQRKVPLIAWFGRRFREDLDLPAIQSKLGNQFTHDNVFHTILRMLEVGTSLYDPKKDILVYRPEHHSNE